MLTYQEIFNKVVEHLRNQMVASVTEAETCAYRGKDGNKCAIGCLIPDELYNKNFEGRSIYNKDIREVVFKSLGYESIDQTVPVGHYGADINPTIRYLIKLLNELQSAHDFSDSEKELNVSLNAIAKEFKLTPHVPIESWTNNYVRPPPI